MQEMKAAVIYEPGGPDVLKIESRPIPTPKAGEVLIRMNLCTQSIRAVHAAGTFAGCQIPAHPGYQGCRFGRSCTRW